jgi:hypothetical protein
LNEPGHHVFNLSLIHLSVRHADLCLRYEILNKIGNALDALNAVVHKKDLPVPLKLMHDRLTDHAFAEACKNHLDGLAVQRRRLDDRKIA